MHLLVAALILLFAGTYILVSRIVYSHSQTYSNAVVSMFTDISVFANTTGDGSFSEENAESLRFYGDYICSWYDDIDYAYIYTLDTENNTKTYIAVSYNREDEKLVKNGDYNYNYEFTGKTVPYTANKEELAVMRGEKIFGHFSANNEYGHEFTTVAYGGDSRGERAFVAVDTSYRTIYAQINKAFLFAALGALVVNIGVYFVAYTIIKRKISAPAEKVSAKMSEYVSNGIRSGEKLDGGETREFAMIATAFNKMTGEIENYVNNIDSLTRDSAKRQTELDIAAKIQLGFLPKRHLISRNYEFRAMMKPAKDVGGDLYDYTPLDENRVLMIIADVSGKGVSAAIYMAITLTLIREYAKYDIGPAEILKRMNNTLSHNNESLLFTTAFLGIYDSKKQTLTYANAGHNPPYIVGESIRALDAPAGTLLGLFEGEEYTQYTEKLSAGETIFLYTDGVTEATNGKNEFYGTKRLEESFARFKDSKAEDLVSFVCDNVASFSDGNEQHDDITILTLTVKDTEELLLDVDIHEMAKIKAKILSLPITRQKQLALCLAAEECFVNICSYAYPSGVPEGEKIKFTVAVSDRIMLRFEDGGMEFNPLEKVEIPEDYDLDTQIGGLGKFITVSNVDDINYEYKDGKNVLTLTKYFGEENK